MPVESKKGKAELWLVCLILKACCRIRKTVKRLIQKDTYSPVFIAALFAIAKIRKQCKFPTSEWIKKM